MIGVAAHEADWEVVREFFQLFKTPWEPYQEKSRYDVIIASRDDFRVEDARAELIVAFGSRGMDLDRDAEVSCADPMCDPLLAFRDSELPIYGNCVSLEGRGVDLIADASGTSRGAAGQLCRVGQSVVVRVGTEWRDSVGVFGRDRHRHGG